MPSDKEEINAAKNNAETKSALDHDETQQTGETRTEVQSKTQSTNGKDGASTAEHNVETLTEGSLATSTDPEDAPPLPDEAPPLPLEKPPGTDEKQEDDGWEPVWEAGAQAFYFYNRLTGASQWTNPRIPDVSSNAVPPAPGTEGRGSSSALTSPPPPTREALPAGGYNPAIHGDYDPNAWYAQPAAVEEPSASITQKTDPSAEYGATAAFNRFTGRFQNSEITPENFNDENKSRRQMNAFFDVDAAANSHDGRSLKAERSGKKLTKTELKNFKEKRKAKKEEKRRAWLRD